MSEEITSAQATESESTSDQESQEPVETSASERTRSFFNRAIRSGRASPASPASQATPPASQPSPDSTPPGAPPQPTAAELDERRIQSEVDRRIARANKAQQDKERRETEVYLRRNDPVSYAQLKEADEASQAQALQEHERTLGTVQSVSDTFDRAVLDPLFLALPKKDQNELLREHAKLTGLESRAALTKGALARLEKHWKAEGAATAEAKLRANPSFTKQLMTEFRGEIEEPDLITASASPAPSAGGMNDWIRASTGRRGRTASRG